MDCEAEFNGEVLKASWMFWEAFGCIGLLLGFEAIYTA